MDMYMNSIDLKDKLMFLGVRIGDEAAKVNGISMIEINTVWV